MTDKLYKKYQNQIKLEEPFNEKLFNMRSEEVVDSGIVSIFNELKLHPAVEDVKVKFDKFEEKNVNKHIKTIYETRTYKAFYEVTFNIQKMHKNDPACVELLVTNKNKQTEPKIASNKPNEEINDDLTGSERVMKQLSLSNSVTENKYEFDPILLDNFEDDVRANIAKENKTNTQKVIVKGSFDVPSLVNGMFYTFKGNRYYVRNQIIDKLVYLVKNSNPALKLFDMELGKDSYTEYEDYKKRRSISNKNSVALRTSTMQLTIDRNKAYLFNGEHIVWSTNLFSFNKNFDTLLLMFAKYSYNLLSCLECSEENFENKHIEYTNTTLLSKINNFYGTNIELVNDDQVEMYSDEYFLKFKLQTRKIKGPTVVVPIEEFNKESITKTLVGSMQYIFEIYCGGYNPKKQDVPMSYVEEKNSDGELIVSVEKFIHRPYVFIDLLTKQIIYKNKNYINKFAKVSGLLLSMKRLINSHSFGEDHREIDEKVDNFLELLRYVLINYDSLLAVDPLDLKNKRIRVAESVVYQLRVKVSGILFRLFAEDNLTSMSIRQAFSSISENRKMLVDDLIKNDLLVYYNNTNEINSLVSLKTTFMGQGGFSKNVPTVVRALHPSYLGKISLVASSNRNPGMTSTLIPFVDVDDNGFFLTDDAIDKEEFK